MKIKSLLIPTSSGLFSAKGFFLRAMAIVLIFALCHLAGLREYTTILCGTLPTEGASRELLAGLGFFYVIMFLAATVVAPILAIASGFMFLREKLYEQQRE